MRKLKINFVLILVIGLIISCQKQDEMVNDYESNNNNLLPNISHKVKNLKFPTNNGMLVFKNLEELKKTVSILEEEMTLYDENFLKMHSNLTSEELESLEDKIAYSEYTPLKIFIQNSNLDALFLHQEKLEKEWLNNEELNLKADPNNHAVEDKALQALLNSKGEVIIGKAIYKMFDFGYVIIKDGSFKTLELIQNNPEKLAYQNVTVIGNQYELKGSGCNSGKVKSGEIKKGNYKIKWRISHRTPITGRRVKVTTTNYKKKKKKKNGWKKTRSYTKCKAFGFISGSLGDCSEQLNFNSDNKYSAWNNKKSWSHKIDVQTKTKSGWLKGYHYGIAGISYTSTLVW